MRLRSLVLTALTALVVVGLPVTSSADPATRDSPPTSLDDTGQAEDVLAAVEALLGTSRSRRAAPAAASNGREATLLLRDLAAGLDDLDPRDQERARSFLARPTDPDSVVTPLRAAATPPPYCREHVCIHYEQGTADAPPRSDTDRNGRPDQVDRTATVMERVWSSFAAAGYRPPLRDSGRGTQGPDQRLDVYLSNIGRHSQYGMCTTDGAFNGRTAPVYCVVDNDFREFPGDPLGNLRATAAHEFFHAVQFAYDVYEDYWLLEGTAAWVEDELFTEVNDNRQYLAASQLAVPHRPLDYPGGLSVYGSWIFWRYLTLRHPGTTGELPTIVRRLWERAGERSGDGRSYSMEALEQELAARGDSLAAVYSGFAEANRHPSHHYDEGSAYLPSPVTDSYVLSARRRAVPTVSTRLDHMTSRTWTFRPGKGIRSKGIRGKLRLVVDMPSARRDPAARVTVVRADRVLHRSIALDRTGGGRLSVPFAGRVRRVELTLVNAGHRYRCDRGSWFSCRGESLDDRLRSTFTARANR